MNQRTRFPGNVLMPAIAALAMLLVAVNFAGCGRQPIAQNESQADAHASVDQPAAQAAVVEQTTCPVMEGNPINKNLFVEYKGKKVYFCCAGCPEKFLANPEKYVAKLPQFQEDGGAGN